MNFSPLFLTHLPTNPSDILNTLTLISTKLADDGCKTKENKDERNPWSLRLVNVSWKTKHGN